MTKLSVLSAVAACFFGFGGLPYGTMYELYQNYAYYFVFAGFFIWLQLLFSFLPEKRRVLAFLRFHFMPLSVSLLVTFLIVIASTPDFRILADETNLLGMSKAMYEDHLSVNPTQQVSFYHGFQRRITSVVDMRPLFFPFSLSVLHSLLGYSENNAFVLNGLSAFLCLFLIYYITYKRFGRFWGVSGLLLLASFPLFVLYSTSAGFEVYNLLFALILLVAFDNFLETKSASVCEFLLYTALLLAQTRYESAAMVLLILPFIISILKKEEYRNFTLRLSVWPLLFLPVAWVRMLTYNNLSFQVGSVDEAFGLSLFLKNLSNALPFFMGKNQAYGMNGVIFIAAVVGLLMVFYKAATKRLFKDCLYPKEAKIFSWFVFMFFLIHACARFAYYWGNLTLQYTSRLGVIFLPLLVFMAVYAFKGLSERFKLHKSWAILIPIIFAVHSWPVAGQNMAVRDITLFREFKTVRTFLAENYPNKKDYIVVAPISNIYVPLNYNAFSMKHLSKEFNQVMQDLRNKTWSYLIVVQKITTSTKEVEKDSQVPEDLILEPLFESQVSVDCFVRISKYSPIY